MTERTPSRPAALSFWRSWANGLWDKAEDAWLRRSGQDHYNRDHVIIPALQASLASEKEFSSLVDIGCGDGYATSLLLSTLDSLGKKPGEIVLLDASERQLKMALCRRLLANARTARIDLETAEWSEQVPLRTSPTVFISVFVLQELPSLAPFLTALANLVRPEDLALCVTLSPSFSQRLRDRGAIRSETDQDNSLKDWRWAGGFPVPVGKETVYLPHFQRDLEQITAIHFEHGLTVTNVKELTVPDTTEARKVFIETVYAEDIIAHPSSVLLTIRKSNQGVKQWHNISDPKNSR